MAITDKTRKLLWGRSGNCCAICRKELVVEATTTDQESIVGDECHIISGKPEGPRYDPSFPTDQVDSCGNLLLLCKVHHKQIDDQSASFPPDKLRKIKSEHEKWVSEQLQNTNHSSPPVRIRRIKENIPKYLRKITSGRDLFQLAGGSCAASLDHDELQSSEEAELVGDFLQSVHDWGELWNELEPSQRVKAEFEMSNSIKELDGAGLAVFAARELMVMEGGDNPPANWSVAYVLLLHKTGTPSVAMPSKIEWTF